MSKINSSHRNPSGGDEGPRGHLAGGEGVKNEGKKERKCFCLQFGHPGSVEADRHTGGAGSVAHLPQHAAPLLLIVLIPNKNKGTVSHL